jgi:hypothetical protein
MPTSANGADTLLPEPDAIAPDAVYGVDPSAPFRLAETDVVARALGCLRNGIVRASDTRSKGYVKRASGACAGREAYATDKPEAFHT